MPITLLSSKQEQLHPCDQYTQLKRRFRDVGRLEAIGEILGRDFLTAMPDGAYRSRLNQIAYLYRRIHQDIINAEVRNLLDKALIHEDNHSADWDDWDRANLRAMAAVYDDHSLIDDDLMEHNAKVANEGRRCHRLAFENHDWDMARDHLRRVVDIERRVAEKKLKARGGEDLYDALLQDYCPGFSHSTIDKWFTGLEGEIKGLLPRIMERQSLSPEPIQLVDRYPADSQMWLNEEVLGLFGFDFERGGLYQTGHNPVEGGTPDDTRLVIKTVDTNNFLDSLKSVMHEAGHGLYIQGLPRKSWRYQPVAADLGSAMQESQALLVEMLIGRTHEFFEFLSPRLEGLFQTMRDPTLHPDNLCGIKTHVRTTVDRKRADEVTYFLHVLLRYRIERDLIEGRVEVDQLPELWTESSYDLLGIAPQDHGEGVLQDVHWFVAKFGYFPSYTLGHMMGAQFYKTMRQDLPDFFGLIKRGDFLPITAWLNKYVHSRGRLMNTDELMRDVTGKGPSPEFLISHFKERYLGEEIT
tara:strand:+ start:324950 stop:326524 length:1575 start_codon:yes stop_codon:yes gene_type:complete